MNDRAVMVAWISLMGIIGIWFVLIALAAWHDAVEKRKRKTMKRCPDCRKWLQKDTHICPNCFEVL